MTSRHRPIVSNDNSLWRDRYLETDKYGPLARLLPHIPTAQKLIARYCQHAFKHDKQDRDYCFLEYQLCTLLENPDRNQTQRNMKMEWIAWALERHPLVLFNDPHLPF
jgi:hypothetical protein